MLEKRDALLTRRQVLGAAAGAAAGLAAAAVPKAAWADEDGGGSDGSSGSAADGFLYAVRDVESGLWGYMDGQGVIVIEPAFSGLASSPDLGVNGFVTDSLSTGALYAIPVAAGLVRGVFQGQSETVQDPETGKWGLIARDGSWLVEPAFDAVTAVVEGGFAAVIKKDGEKVLSYWSDKGEKLFDCSPDVVEARAFCGGVASISDGEGWALIDAQGNWLLKSAENPKAPYCYSKAMVFSEGVAWDWDAAAYIDTQGKEKFNLESWNYVPFEDGFAAGLWSEEGRVAGGVPLDASGNKLKELEDYGGGSGLGTVSLYANSSWAKFSEGLCSVCCVRHEAWGAIDAQGDWAIPPKFDALGDFREGHALARRLGDGAVGVVDETGAWVAPPVFRSDSEVSRFSRGLAFVGRTGLDADGKEVDACGWITPEGRWVFHWGEGLKEASDEAGE